MLTDISKKFTLII